MTELYDMADRIWFQSRSSGLFGSYTMEHARGRLMADMFQSPTPQERRDNESGKFFYSQAPNVGEPEGPFVFQSPCVAPCQG